MKKILITLIFSTISTLAFANSGKFNASGMGSWEMNIMNAGNGNMAITYDGNVEAVMAVYKYKDGKIFSLETGATPMSK